jgi:hypothetical protein
MNDDMECMCLECGVSNYVGLASITLEAVEGSDMKVIKQVFCLECGGPLILVGKAGDQPRYRLS